MGYMATAIMVTLALVGLGIAIDQLARLKKWLKSSTTDVKEVPKPPDRTD
jgi:hypothetical protein